MATSDIIVLSGVGSSKLICIFCAITTIGVIRLSAFIIVFMNKMPLLKLMKLLFTCWCVFL